MPKFLRRPSVVCVVRHVPAGVLAVTVGGLAVGGGLHLAGDPGAGDVAWLAVSACGLCYAAWAMADSLRRRRAGVDVIALLALAGAVAVGELLAAAVITVMLASGRGLEGWAAGRARRDLTGLLRRVPRTPGVTATASWRRYRLPMLSPATWSWSRTATWYPPTER